MPLINLDAAGSGARIGLSHCFVLGIQTHRGAGKVCLRLVDLVGRDEGTKGLSLPGDSLALAQRLYVRFFKGGDSPPWQRAGRT
jgi:hypothetical protein